MGTRDAEREARRLRRARTDPGGRPADILAWAPRAQAPLGRARPARVLSPGGIRAPGTARGSFRAGPRGGAAGGGGRGGGDPTQGFGAWSRPRSGPEPRPAHGLA